MNSGKSLLVTTSSKISAAVCNLSLSCGDSIGMTSAKDSEEFKKSWIRVWTIFRVITSPLSSRVACYGEKKKKFSLKDRQLRFLT